MAQTLSYGKLALENMLLEPVKASSSSIYNRNRNNKQGYY